jgi:hypothetical protein
VGGGYGSDMLNNLNVLDFDNSFEAYHTPPPSPCAGHDVSDEVFVTPRSSPANKGTGPVTSGMSPGSSIPTPPYTTLGIPRTMRPRLSDVFATQVPDIPALSGVAGLVSMPLATLVPVPARPSVTLGVDFIQRIKLH